MDASYRAPKPYRCCIVPRCSNTTISTPDKVFVHVPKEQKRRKLWIEACRRNLEDLSPKSSLYCCEDHFRLEEDMENWLMFKLVGSHIRMKRDVIPHIFDCLSDSKKDAVDVAARKRKSPFAKGISSEMPNPESDESQDYHEDGNPSFHCDVVIQEDSQNYYGLGEEDEEVPVEIPQTIVKVEPIDPDIYDQSSLQVESFVPKLEPEDSFEEKDLEEDEDLKNIYEEIVRMKEDLKGRKEKRGKNQGMKRKEGECNEEMEEDEMCDKDLECERTTMVEGEVFEDYVEVERRIEYLELYNNAKQNYKGLMKDLISKKMDGVINERVHEIEVILEKKRKYLRDYFKKMTEKPEHEEKQMEMRRKERNLEVYRKFLEQKRLKERERRRLKRYQRIQAIEPTLAKEEAERINIPKQTQERILKRRQYIREYQRKRRARLRAERMGILYVDETESCKEKSALRKTNCAQDKKEADEVEIFTRKEDMSSSSKNEEIASKDEKEVMEIEDRTPSTDTKSKCMIEEEQNKTGVYLLQIPVTLLLKLNPKEKQIIQKDPLSLGVGADSNIPFPPILLSQPYSLKNQMPPSTSSVNKDPLSLGDAVHETEPVPIRLTRAFSTRMDPDVRTLSLKTFNSSFEDSLVSSEDTPKDDEEIQRGDDVIHVDEGKTHENHSNSGNVYGFGVIKREISPIQEINDLCSFEKASNEKKTKFSEDGFDVEVSEDQKVEKRSYLCDVCGLVTSSRDSMHNHSKVNSKQRQFECKLCCKSFVHKCNLEKHGLLHKGKRKFSCDKCDKTYVMRHDLVSHKKSHDEDWTFICDFCGKGFHCRSNLFVHSRTHSVSKRFKCPKCDLSLTTASDLKHHLSSHSTIKPHQCSRCRKKFARNEALKKHKCHSGDEILVEDMKKEVDS